MMTFLELFKKSLNFSYNNLTTSSIYDLIDLASSSSNLVNLDMRFNPGYNEEEHKILLSILLQKITRIRKDVNVRIIRFIIRF